MKFKDVTFIEKKEVVKLHESIASNIWKGKFKKALSILETYSQGEHPIDICCKQNGVPYSTFNNWVLKVGEIGELYSQSKKKFNHTHTEKVLAESQFSLLKLIKGHEVTNESITYKTTPEGKEIIVSRKVDRKSIPPNPHSVLSSLYNLSNGAFKPVNAYVWGEQQRVKSINQEEQKTNIDSLTDLELINQITTLKHDLLKLEPKEEIIKAIDVAQTQLDQLHKIAENHTSIDERYDKIIKE